MSTTISENDYKFSQVESNVNQIPFTNGTTRTIKFRELVVSKDSNNNAFVGFVATAGGIEAGKKGMIDLFEKQTIATNQFTTATFKVSDSNVFITAQTNSSQALITQATGTGKFLLPALILDYSASGTLRLRMPPQTGNITAIS